MQVPFDLLHLKRAWTQVMQAWLSVAISDVSIETGYVFLLTRFTDASNFLANTLGGGPP